MQQLQPFQHRAVPLCEEPVGDVQAVVRINPYQVRVAGGVLYVLDSGKPFGTTGCPKRAPTCRR